MHPFWSHPCLHESAWQNPLASIPYSPTASGCGGCHEVAALGSSYCRRVLNRAIRRMIPGPGTMPPRVAPEDPDPLHPRRWCVRATPRGGVDCPGSWAHLAWARTRWSSAWGHRRIHVRLRRVLDATTTPAPDQPSDEHRRRDHAHPRLDSAAIDIIERDHDTIIQRAC